MSVVGFDVGNDASCVAIARRRGIDVLMNKESKRETPAVVSFGDKMRFIGTDGAAKWPMNVPNTAYQVQRLLGKQFRDPTVQQDIAKLPFKVSEGPNGGCLVELLFCNELHTFTPEQLTAMLLVDLKRIAEVEAGVPVNDCCISVPTYFTEAERYAMLAAAQVAGLNCLQLVNETTATALAYGIFKTDLADEAVNVAFVIVGQASTQVSIAAVKKSGLQIRSHAWDRALGGRDFDELLFDHFADEFKAKTKADVRGNKKACFKLRVACEKLKKVLSANAEAPISVECLVDEIDMRGTMTRDKFEEMAAPLTARIRATTESALKLSGLAAQDVASIEIVGSSTRMPAIFRCVEEVFGRAPSRTLNSKEVMSRGCALKCAMISPVIKVRDYDVIDAAPYPVQFTWDKDGAPASQVLFDKFNPIPSTKMLTFMRSAPFTITAQYAEDGDLPAAAPRKIGEVSVGPFSVPAGAEKAKLKVKVQLNLNGLISVEGVTMVEEQEVAAEAAADAAAQKDVSMADAGGEAAPAADGDAAAAAAADVPMADAAAAPKAAEKKVRTIKHDVPFTAAAANALSPKQVADLHEKEVAMQAADRLQEETNDRKNALEAYIYAMRNKLHDGLAPYAKDADKEAFMAQLNKMEDWLYEEGEDTTKSVYAAKLEELKRVGGPIEARAAEEGSRGGAADELQALCQHYWNQAKSDAPLYAHIPAEEKATVVKECEAALNWLNEKKAMQAQAPKWQDPVLVTADIVKKMETVERVCKPIMSRPAPKPAAQPAPAPEPAKEEAAPMETEAGGAAGAEGAAAAGGGGDDQQMEA